MTLAIHDDDRQNSFTKRWIDYCEEKNIDYRLVDCYNDDIISQLDDCDALLWNWNNNDYKSKKFARQLIYSIEHAGKKVFPDSKTCWHYDDKIGQKYLLESVHAPIVPTYVFYDQASAFSWIDKVGFPKVFKLSSGSGANNVRLAHDKDEAKRLVKRSFGRGFAQMDRIGSFKDKYDAWVRSKSRRTAKKALRAFARIFVPTEFEKMEGKESGYAYFQDFIPDNEFDIRVITIGKRAFGLKRMCREGDFRASGSGMIDYTKEHIDERCVKIAFETSERLNTQSAAYDFVFNKTGDPLIVEISYAFSAPAYDSCEGYWDPDLNWHTGDFNPQYWMIEDLIASL